MENSSGGSMDDILPLYTGVVRLKSYGKGEDVHVCRSKRPHLFVLTPDAIQVFTTADAGPAEDPVEIATRKSGVSIIGRAKQASGPFARFSSRGILAGNSRAASGFAGEDDIHSKASRGLEERPSGPLDDAEDLKEGQIFRLGVALNQVLRVEIVKDVRLKIFYQPNKPSKKGSFEEQTMMVLKGLLRSVDVTKWLDYSSSSSPMYLRNAHHFTIVTESPEEALALKDDIEMSQRQLAMAVLWLSEGLPLRGDSTALMLTVGQSSNATAPSSRSGSPTGATNPSSSGTYAFTVPFPRWETEIELPNEVSGALASPSSRRSLSTSIKVYLSTPLGPAIAEIPLLALVQSAAEGSAPVTTVATLQDPYELESRRLQPAKRWQVMLQWRAVKGEVVSASVSSASAGLGQGQGNSVHGSAAVGSSGALSTLVEGSGGSSCSAYSNAGGPHSSSRAVAVPSRSGHSGSMTVLVGLAALSGASAVARRVRTQLARLRGGGPIPPPGAPQPWYRWKIALLELALEKETEKSAKAMPAVKRALSVTIAHPSGLQPSTGLPHHIELLAQQYPQIITPDIARRFIVGLGNDNKAFAALSTMAHWVTENRLGDILIQPQPAFSAMKRHYPHSFPGWSTKKDCLVEIECMGRWPRAYDGLAAENVSEQAMLEHLLFIYQYAFAKLDPRPLPNGKTVKIVDLEGLSMGDLRTPGFKLITRVGAMLGMNYPQRLQQCFLINAPGWWAVAWKLVSPIIPPKVRSQMKLFAKNDKESARKAMLEWIDEEVLPVEYGGKNETPVSEYPLEIEMAAYVAKLNSAATGSGGGDEVDAASETSSSLAGYSDKFQDATAEI